SVQPNKMRMLKKPDLGASLFIRLNLVFRREQKCLRRTQRLTLDKAVHHRFPEVPDEVREKVQEIASGIALGGVSAKPRLHTNPLLPGRRCVETSGDVFGRL